MSEPTHVGDIIDLKTTCYQVKLVHEQFASGTYEYGPDDLHDLFKVIFVNHGTGNEDVNQEFAKLDDAVECLMGNSVRLRCFAPVTLAMLDAMDKGDLKLNDEEEI